MSTTAFDAPEIIRLRDIFTEMESAVIAYSGGVDSTFLLKAAVLSGIGTMAVTAVSPAMPGQDFRDAKDIARRLGVRHTIIESGELELAEFVKNPVDRCFYCKDHLFGRLKEIARSAGYRFVLDGSNLDDLHDWRPGRKAALKHGIRSPLIEAGLRKQDVRRLSRELSLPTWDKPSSPCLSSRFPYGETITREALKQVEAAETFLKSLGFQEVRVRHHRDVARIELKEQDIPKMLNPETRTAVREKLISLGYKFVSLDLEEFRSGRLNG
ncbi:MAG TPA: ATP-dependent sacrificial sulfur transferase LarE [Thermodesulfovibrionales bacterium]|nr:ATP-dependent sacrificial sulfur transferase LarE [Thermodesulfovibrionales bacterium]